VVATKEASTYLYEFFAGPRCKQLAVRLIATALLHYLMKIIVLTMLRHSLLTKKLVLALVISVGLLQSSASAQQMTYCPGTKFFKYPHNVKPVSPEIPEGGIGMVSASDVWNILNRDPGRINGWVEVFLVDGRGGDPKGPY